MSKYGFRGGYERPPDPSPKPPELPKFDSIKNHIKHHQLVQSKRKNFDTRFQHSVFCTSPRLEKRTWFDRHGIKVLSVFYLSGLVFMFSPVIYGIYTGSRKNEKNEIYQAELKKEFEKRFGEGILSSIIFK